ncbi:MAG: hypothetical protein WCL27_11235 [Betaproteobacteria bacterium]
MNDDSKRNASQNKKWRKWMIIRSIAFFVIWIIEGVLLLNGGSVFLVILLGLAASALAMYDWRRVRTLAKQPSTIPELEALRRGEIDLDEFGRRRELYK